MATTSWETMWYLWQILYDVNALSPSSMLVNQSIGVGVGVAVADDAS